MIRVRPIGIRPLELWDLRVADGILWDHMQSPEFGHVLCDTLTKVWNGLAETCSEGVVPEWVYHFNHLYLCGGGAAAVALDLQNGPWQSVRVGKDLGFAGEVGGKALLTQNGLSGWVLDLGQSTLKISGDGRRQTWPRDLIRLPMREEDEKVSDSMQRIELRGFLAATLREFRQSLSTYPQGVVCALPSRLDDAGVPEGSSYIGMKGDASLLPDALVEAGLGEAQILLLNDAELAAVSAQQNPEVSSSTLVLTIGFGVGAAFIE